MVADLYLSFGRKVSTEFKSKQGVELMRIRGCRHNISRLIWVNDILLSDYSLIFGYQLQTSHHLDDVIKVELWLFSFDLDILLHRKWIARLVLLVVELVNMLIFRIILQKSNCGISLAYLHMHISTVVTICSRDIDTTKNIWWTDA